MARNEEKLFGRLNRLHLQKQREAELAKNPRRPPVHTVTTASELRKWIPTISRDLDLAVKQLAVPCYPERVIDDVHDKISKLKREYQLFTQKLRQLDPSSLDNYDGSKFPQLSTYGVNKRQHVDNNGDEQVEAKKSTINTSSESNREAFQAEFLATRIKTPILDKETEDTADNFTQMNDSCESVIAIASCDHDLQDKLLVIDKSKLLLLPQPFSKRHSIRECNSYLNHGSIDNSFISSFNHDLQDKPLEIDKSKILQLSQPFSQRCSQRDSYMYLNNGSIKNSSKYYDDGGVDVNEEKSENSSNIYSSRIDRTPISENRCPTISSHKAIDGPKSCEIHTPKLSDTFECNSIRESSALGQLMNDYNSSDGEREDTEAN